MWVALRNTLGLISVATLCVSCSDFELASHGDGDDDDTTEVGGGDDDDTFAEEICNGEDDDGDGLVDEGFGDVDGDGVADCLDGECQATLPTSVAEVDASCEGDVELGEPPTAPWNVVVEWAWEGGHVFSIPAVGDLDGDGLPEVAFTYNDTGEYTDGGSVAVLRGTDGELLWTASGFNSLSGVALGDLDLDGFGEIIVYTYLSWGAGQASVVALNHDGTTLWTSASFELWQEANAPAVADLDGDGTVEVVVSDRVLDGATGATEVVLTQGSGGRTWGQPVAVDMDLDGRLEILLENQVYDHQGNLLYECGHGGLMTFPHPIEADGDDRAELLVAGWGWMGICDDDGSTLWSEQDLTYYEGPAVVVADFDGDGLQEFAHPRKSNLHIIEPDGSTAWYAPIDDFSGAAGCMGWDVTLDGIPEVIYADEHDLHVFDVATGTHVVLADDHSSLTSAETPSVADVDGDGQAELLFASNGETFHGVRALGSALGEWPYARPVYNQQSYSGGNIADDLTVPAQPVPPWLDEARMFRGQPSALYSAASPNLRAHVTDVCVASCDPGGFAQLAVQVFNDGGAAASEAATVRVYGTPDGSMVLLGEIALDQPLEPGSSVETTVDTSVDDLGATLLTYADEDDDLLECHEDDNFTAVAVDPCS